MKHLVDCLIFKIDQQINEINQLSCPTKEKLIDILTKEKKAILVASKAVEPYLHGGYRSGHYDLEVFDRAIAKARFPFVQRFLDVYLESKKK